MKTSNPILITGVPRSGATFIARLLAMSGAQVGEVNRMFESVKLTEQNKNLLHTVKRPLEVKESIESATFNYFAANITNIVQTEQIHGLKWLFKSNTLTLAWRYWNKLYPDAQWVIVRRKPPYIINSCTKTAYMDMMKSAKIRDHIGVKTEQDGWKWLIKQYEHQWREMYRAGLNIVEVYPDRMANEDFTQVKILVRQCNFTWNTEIEKVAKTWFKKKGDK
jgi:hypothetical protein